MVTVVSNIPHKSVVKETICTHCGSTLEYVPNDVDRFTITDYDGSSETYTQILCPNCVKYTKV